MSKTHLVKFCCGTIDFVITFAGLGDPTAGIVSSAANLRRSTDSVERPRRWCRGSASASFESRSNLIEKLFRVELLFRRRFSSRVTGAIAAAAVADTIKAVGLIGRPEATPTWLKTHTVTCFIHFSLC